MTTRSGKARGLDSSLKKLSISPTSKPKPSSIAVTDSWEEGATTSSSEEDDSDPSTPIDNSETPGPPPPTPISPTSRHGRHKSTDWSAFGITQAQPYSTASTSTLRSSAAPEKRPEKSSAAAGRMIAGALGVKAPKKTEEGKAYERAVRENERQRREKMKEEARRQETEKEEARKAVWDE